MNPSTATLIYKLVCLAAGGMFGLLGYRLFVKGIFEGAGDMNAGFKDTQLVLKKAAPGTFFALFGALVIAVTVHKGMDLKVEGNQAKSERFRSEGSGIAPVAAEEITDLDNLKTLIYTSITTGVKIEGQDLLHVQKFLQVANLEEGQSIHALSKSSTDELLPIAEGPPKPRVTPWATPVAAPR